MKNTGLRAYGFAIHSDTLFSGLHLFTSSFIWFGDEHTGAILSWNVGGTV